MRLAAVLLVAASLAIAAPAFTTPADELDALMDEYWAWVLRESPTLATSVGVRDYDDQIGDISLSAEDRRAAQSQAFLTRLEAIPADDLSPTDRTSRDILAWQLAAAVEGNRFPQRTILFTTYYGWHQGFVGLANNVPLQTPADFESYIARLRLYPTLNDEAIRISDQAIAGGYTQPCAVLDGFETTISGVIPEDPRQSRFFEPFTRPRPPGVSEVEFQRFADETLQVIETVLEPEYRQHLEWYRESYLPACRPEVGVSAQPGGGEYYAFRVRQETTTDFTPEQIHQIGLDEVARIRAEMEAVATGAGFASREAYIEHLRTDARYFATTPEELLAAAAWEAKRLDGLMPTMFGRLARLPYGLRAIPAETAEGTTTAYYNGGSPESGISGTYYVNTSLLDQRPLWELPALTAHEAVPGHHHQIALQQELDLPEWRRFASGFNAFTEGWGLYSERLGIEMGIYDDPAENMGRLSYEMWRACRLVVDTGIHAMGWSKERAIAYMRDNTALSDANIEAEVNRYISWPGQALGYKLGELRIRALRARAEQALGDRFDIRAFHDAVLSQGSLPLDVLERQIERWIAEQGAANGSG